MNVIKWLCRTTWSVLIWNNQIFILQDRKCSSLMSLKSLKLWIFLHMDFHVTTPIFLFGIHTWLCLLPQSSMRLERQHILPLVNVVMLPYLIKRFYTYTHIYKGIASCCNRHSPWTVSQPHYLNFPSAKAH